MQFAKDEPADYGTSPGILQMNRRRCQCCHMPIPLADTLTHWNAPDIAELVENILLEADGLDYRMQAWVIMANHVHLVVDVWNVPLVKIINSWKGKSSRLANVLLHRRGTFWQEDTTTRSSATRRI